MDNNSTTTGNIALILDDDAKVLDLYQIWFSELGFEVITCKDFQRFQDHLAQQPSLIVLDLIMPESDGIAVMQYLEQQANGIPVLIISGTNIDVLAVSSAAAQAKGVNVIGAVTKKITFEGLAEIIQRASDDGEFSKSSLTDMLRGRDVDFHFQPIMDLRQKTICSYEALMRVDGEPIGTTMRRYLESANGAESIWSRSLSSVLESMSQWLPQQIHVSINISPLVLSDPAFFDLFKHQIEELDIDPQQLTLELTESRNLVQPADTAQSFARLRLLGVRVALDDYGKGYANLERMRFLPFTDIKFDRSLIAKAMYSESDGDHFRQTVQTAKNLGMVTTVEGVETTQQLQWAHQAGIDQAQGFLIGKPMPSSQVLSWQKNWGG